MPINTATVLKVLKTFNSEDDFNDLKKYCSVECKSRSEKPIPEDALKSFYQFYQQLLNNGKNENNNLIKIFLEVVKSTIVVDQNGIIEPEMLKAWLRHKYERENLKDKARCLLQYSKHHIEIYLDYYKVPYTLKTYNNKQVFYGIALKLEQPKNVQSTTRFSLPGVFKTILLICFSSIVSALIILLFFKCIVQKPNSSQISLPYKSFRWVYQTEPPKTPVAISIKNKLSKFTWTEKMQITIFVFVVGRPLLKGSEKLFKKIVNRNQPLISRTDQKQSVIKRTNVEVQTDIRQTEFKEMLLELFYKKTVLPSVKSSPLVSGVKNQKERYAAQNVQSNTMFETFPDGETPVKKNLKPNLEDLDSAINQGKPN